MAWIIPLLDMSLSNILRGMEWQKSDQAGLGKGAFVSGHDRIWIGNCNGIILVLNSNTVAEKIHCV